MNMKRFSNINSFSASILISLFTGVLLILIHVLPAIGQEEQKKDAWEGRLADGTTITKEDLSKITEGHKKWIDTDKKEGKRATLIGANLTGANLEKAIVAFADFSSSWFKLRNIEDLVSHGAKGLSKKRDVDSKAIY